MKTQKACAFSSLLFAICLHASAQNAAPPLNEPDYNKPKIFTDLPDKLTLHMVDADGLLNLAVGSVVNSAIANGFKLSGTVVSRSNPADPSLQSVVIKSNRGGAIFNLSRIKKADGSFRYRGCMLSKGAGDALEIVQTGNDYVLQKKGYYDLINE